MRQSQKLSEGLRWLSLRDIKGYFYLSRNQDALRLIDLLDVPVMLYHRAVPPIGTSGKSKIIEAKVLALSLELALFAHMLPGGPGINLLPKTVGLGRRRPITDAVRRVSPILRVVDYWDAFRKDPYKLQLMVALASLMYGPYDKAELDRRLHALGHWLATHTWEPRRRAKKRLADAVMTGSFTPAKEPTDGS